MNWKVKLVILGICANIALAALYGAGCTKETEASLNIISNPRPGNTYYEAFRDSVEFSTVGSRNVSYYTIVFGDCGREVDVPTNQTTIKHVFENKGTFVVKGIAHNENNHADTAYVTVHVEFHK